MNSSPNHPDEPKKIGQVKLDPNQLNYLGMASNLNLPEINFFFVEDILEYYSPIWVVSHDGNLDISIFFGRFRLNMREFITDLVCSFNNNTIIKFLAAIKPFSAPITTFKPSSIVKPENVLQESVKTQLKGMAITNKTTYFAPNFFFCLESGNELQIYFGRSLGFQNDKPQVLLVTSVILNQIHIKNMYNLIISNIINYEKKLNHNIDNLVLNKLQENYRDVLDDIGTIRNQGE